MTDHLDKPLTRLMRPDGAPLSLKDYEKGGGYQALRRALGSMTPSEVTEAIKKANLKGRGGAGFPAGVKWGFVTSGEKARRPKYVTVNGDEMEPGTFKDRLLMERNPHQLIEGILLAAYAVQADISYIFLRWAYHPSAAALNGALEEARRAGYLGRDILGKGFHQEMHVHQSAGRYMAGEETGLINSLEGRRASPRAKPPYPGVSGLFGKPTLVNNVETLSCVPHIILNGPEWFLGLSRTDEGGTKLYGVSGRVKKPGLWELPLGTTEREILMDHAGGMRDGLKFRGLLPGGASTGFVVESGLDVPMDFSHSPASGSRVGTGTAIVLDDGTCPVGFLRAIEMFFARESCGWCTPCREGLAWILKTLDAIEEGRGRPEDMTILDELARNLTTGHTYCALAPGAVEPLAGALKHFREDFDRHITEGRCPWK
jgi:NADH-quinone oxidoreductase subunit F